MGIFALVWQLILFLCIWYLLQSIPEPVDNCDVLPVCLCVRLRWGIPGFRNMVSRYFAVQAAVGSYISMWLTQKNSHPAFQVEVSVGIPGKVACWHPGSLHLTSDPVICMGVDRFPPLLSCRTSCVRSNLALWNML